MVQSDCHCQYGEMLSYNIEIIKLSCNEIVINLELFLAISVVQLAKIEYER